jgi:hypothetical protein
MAKTDALIAVFPRGEEQAVRRHLDRAGIPPQAIRVDDPDDARLALHAEQVEEVDRAAFAPQAGVLLTKEAAKTTTVAVPVGALIGALVLLPLSFIPMGELAWWARALWLMAIGAAGGATVAFISGSAMAAKDPLEPSLLERGVVVVVPASEQARTALLQLEPIRLDQISLDGDVERVTTEEDREPGGALEETVENIEREADAPPTDRHR